MPSLLEELSQQDVWLDYLAYKRENAHLSKREETELFEFVQEKSWLPAAKRMLIPGKRLGIPEKKFINKLGTSSKRVVYSFAHDEQQVLKLMAWLLYRYDDAHAPQCYSFRRGIGAHKAIRKLVTLPQIDALYGYKLDVQDYFNSIDVGLLLPILSEVLSDDEQLYLFFVELLQADQAYFEGRLVHEKRGAIAGTPTAPFLANLYLRDMDRQLAEKACAYARYSDDIIMFAKSAAQSEVLRMQAAEQLSVCCLRPNPSKEAHSLPGETWEFLGIAYQRGTIDISTSTQQKLKGKIRRKARALRRWMLRKDASSERAIAAMIRSMNRKFFERGVSHDLTWSRWFFPLINTSEGLAVIDAYLQQELRYIATGRHSKANNRIRYDSLKELGYRSLVHEYYAFKQQRRNSSSG